MTGSGLPRSFYSSAILPPPRINVLGASQRLTAGNALLQRTSPIPLDQGPRDSFCTKTDNPKTSGAKPARLGRPNVEPPHELPSDAADHDVGL